MAWIPDCNQGEFKVIKMDLRPTQWRKTMSDTENELTTQEGRNHGYWGKSTTTNLLNQHNLPPDDRRWVKSSPHHRNCLSAPKAQRILWKGRWKDYKRRRIRKFAARLCVLVASEAVPIKSHQQDLLNMNWTKTTLINTPRWTGKAQEASMLFLKLCCYFWIGTHLYFLFFIIF